MEHLLEVRNISAGYDARPVLHGVSLAVAQGQVVAVVGPNGAGKSTLLKAVFGLVRVSLGEVILRGQPIQNRNPANNVGSGVSYVPQGSQVFTELSVLENLKVGGHLVPRQELGARIEETLAAFPGLHPLKTRRAATLSTGEKQMLAVARALMLKPAFLLADEPSLGLGPKPARAALASIRDAKAHLGAGILLVEQNVREAMAIADRVHVLRLGRVVLSADPSSLSTEALREAFLGQTHTP